ncbi:MAG: D-aminoacylase [Bacteroidia bacterium]|nr:MAG: D-aminoacylase [Bacteroidia bacterium]
MNRREFLTYLSAISLLPLLSFQTEKLTYVFFNGKIYSDGRFLKGFVGINTMGKIVFSQNPLIGELNIDCKGLIIAPGFIDILADNASNPDKTYWIFEKYKLTDGCTTPLQMHGGSDECGIFYKNFALKPHYTNYGVSTMVMTIRNKYPSLAVRLKKVEQNLDEGALGVSHSIEYQPTEYSELLAYAKLAAKYQRTFFLHLRYSAKETELEGIKEAIQIAKDSGAAVHIDHIHSTGGTYNMPKALDLIKEARKSGLKITACVYPFSYWATYLPSKRFDPGWQQRYNLTYSDLTVVGTGETLTKEKFELYRKGYNRLVAVPEGTMNMKNTVDLALKEDFVMIGSDGGIESEPRANNHPRGASCYATALSYAKKIQMPIEKMLFKMIDLPKTLVQKPLENRGKIQNNYWADLVIFNPDTIQGKATVANPNQFSQGIEYVFVNGKLAYEKGQLKNKAGAAIKYPSK